MEGIVFDAGGQLLAGSFQDYAVPRADDFAALISPPPTKAAVE
jgi:CO/xanthine dehydrogenase Mo-binding subunit